MPRVLISVATFKRPHLLQELLESIESTNPPGQVRICIVDNDPAGSAETVARATSLAMTYLCEPRPGIAAARNRGLSAIEPDDDFVVFVDDDERVEKGWLQALLDAQAMYAADVVSGPVISVFDKSAPRWIEAGGFIQRPRFSTGSPSLSPATNNTLLSLAHWRAAGSPTFDEGFSMTGGSDTEFFRRLRDGGARMVWSDEAVVHEDVPSSRANFRWIWRRGIREGNVTGRLHLRRKSRLRLAADGVSRILYGGIRQIVCFVGGRGWDAKSIAYLTRGIGWIGASTDRLVVEYARSPEPDTK